MNYKISNHKIIYVSLIFTLLYLIKKGVIYSTFGDQLWSHFFIFGNNFRLENDIFGFANLQNKSIWISFMRSLTVYLNKYMIFYSFIAIHTFLFFFIIIKIFIFLSPANFIQVFLIGLAFISPEIRFSGSGAIMHELSFIYRSTSFILSLISIYYLLNQRLNLSLIIIIPASLIHLPVSIIYFLLFLSMHRKFKIDTYILFLLVILFFFVFNIDSFNIYSKQNNDTYIEKIISLRQGYLYFQNWNLYAQLTYVLLIITLLSLLINYQKKITYEFRVLIFLTLSYFLIVLIFNIFNFFQIFKYGREYSFLMIFFVSHLILRIENLKLTIHNFLIIYAITVLSFLGDIVQFLFIYNFLLIKDKNKKTNMKFFFK